MWLIMMEFGLPIMRCSSVTRLAAVDSALAGRWAGPPGSILWRPGSFRVASLLDADSSAAYLAGVECEASEACC